MDTREKDSLMEMMETIGRRARLASFGLVRRGEGEKNRALRGAARSLREGSVEILRANGYDLELVRGSGFSGSLIDRLTVTEDRIEGMARGLEAMACLGDPVGRVQGSWVRPNGLRIDRVCVPLGVIGMVYESRPNVTADAAGLCIKSGNSVILRGGSESFYSSGKIGECVVRGLLGEGLDEYSVQLVPTTDRRAVQMMLRMKETIDLIIPRGGRSLIDMVLERSSIPVLSHRDGVCHVYVDVGADLEKALRVTYNAKMRRTSVCGAAETLLVDSRVVGTYLPRLVCMLLDSGCRVRGDEVVCGIDGRVEVATEEDWFTEYLDACISVRVVGGVDEAIEHIGMYGSHHTDAIITEDRDTAEYFLDRVDSAIVLWNASTQFADGGEFGMGGEIGIATGRLHARGPVGVEQLTTYKYVVRGTGQVRP